MQEADQLLVNGDYIGDIIRGIYRREAIDCPAGCHVAASGFPLPLEARFSGGLTINGYPDPAAVCAADQPALPAEEVRPGDPRHGRRFASDHPQASSS